MWRFRRDDYVAPSNDPTISPRKWVAIWTLLAVPGIALLALLAYVLF